MARLRRTDRQSWGDALQLSESSGVHLTRVALSRGALSIHDKQASKYWGSSNGLLSAALGLQHFDISEK